MFVVKLLIFLLRCSMSCLFDIDLFAIIDVCFMCVAYLFFVMFCVLVCDYCIVSGFFSLFGRVLY